MIIGIGHESNVGKDTLCMFLIDYLRSRNMKGLKIIREGYADRLYEVAHMFYSWAGFQTAQYYGIHRAAKEQVLPLLGKTPRQILIDLSKKLNEYDPDMFHNAVCKNKNFHLKIIPDLRRSHEFDAIDAVGGYKLRIKMDGYTSTHEMDTELGQEPYLSRWDKTITNKKGELKCFQQAAIDFAEEVVIPTLQKSRIVPMLS